ncbi:hypothetical protein D3C76_719390 [compost metagenome]
MPAVLGIGYGLLVGKPEQKVTVRIVELLVNIAGPVGDCQLGGRWTLGNDIGIDSYGGGMRLTEPPMLIYRPDVRRHPVENTVLQQLRLAHMTQQIRQMGVLT